jgi:hypothetical protein
MKVYQSIGQVSAALAKEGISKDRSNQQQGYKFRGIDDCLNALAPLLASHNLVILPEVLEREVIERQTKSGGALFYVTVKVKYAFVNAEDGSRHDVVTYGEAMDSADKATNKAMSAAYKYAVIQTFCIPTEGDNDADATTHDVAAQKAQAFQQQKQVAQEKVNELRAPAAAVKLPNYGRNHCKGKPVTDPVVTNEDLQFYLNGAIKNLADPGKAQYHANDLRLKDAIEAEFERREQRQDADEQAEWNAIFTKVEYDPDLAELKEQVKSDLGIETLLYSKTNPDMRSVFVQAFKQAAADNNIADRLTAIGL